MPDDNPTRASGDGEASSGSRRIGRFVLRRVIASGAMGTVYEAIQEHPRRPVAIKVMKKGVTSSSALRRFEFESQLLARLHHPGVAEVYEAGTYDDGTGPVPYFAMEYIPKACSITAYANSKNLGTRARLELFAKVCDAVQHGHQKGIVHRDLKPDNIIVGPDGQPKIIDFGVARATDSDLAFATLQTEVGQLVGTLQYMSPEQVEADPHDIDIRSDVYSLGVILYEMLVGRLPYDLTSVTTLEAARRIRDETPDRIGSADRRLVGDVETIVHKALEKDRERRYQSAGELAADIRRNLARQPITARPPTFVYTLRVFARRNRALVGAVAAVFVALVLGAATSTALYVRAESQRVEAERQAERAMKSIGFVVDMVHSVNPQCRGEQVLVSDLLDGYGEKLGKAFPDDPEIEATIRASIGQCYSFLDLFEAGGKAEDYKRTARQHLRKAVELRRQVLGPDHINVQEAKREYATLLQRQDRYVEAEAVFRDVWETFTRTLGEDDPKTITAYENIARVLQDQSRFDEAERIVREVIGKRREVLGEEDPETLSSMRLLGAVLHDRGELGAAEEIVRSVYDVTIRTSGEDDEQMRDARRQLAGIFLAQGKVDEACEIYGNRPLPESMAVDHWFQGEARAGEGPLQMFVALEIWCPYSAGAMPRVEGIYETYRDRGLEVIGLTQMTYGSTEEKVWAFIRDFGMTFPVAKVTEDVSPDLFPGGVPHALIAKEATVVWEGHPDEISRDAFEQLVAAN